MGDESGATMLEYAIMVALVATLAVVAVKTLRGRTVQPSEPVPAASSGSTSTALSTTSQF